MWKPIIGILVLAALTGFAELPGFAQEPPEDFFTGSVQPLLSASCLSCHNQKVRSSGLALDARQDVLTGGNRGPAITAGSPDSSLMIQAVEHAGDLKMPPVGKPERPADRHSSAVDPARCCVALERIGCEGHCRPGPLGVSAAQTCNAARGPKRRLGPQSSRSVHSGEAGGRRHRAFARGGSGDSPAARQPGS